MSEKSVNRGKTKKDQKKRTRTAGSRAVQGSNSRSSAAGSRSAQTRTKTAGNGKTVRTKTVENRSGGSKAGGSGADRARPQRKYAGRGNSEKQNYQSKSPGGTRLKGKSARKPNRGSRIGAAAIILFFALATILAFATTWLLTLWANLSMEEVVYHLSTTIEGTNPDMIYEALFKYGLPACLIIAAFIALLRFFRKKRLNPRPLYLLALLIAVAELIGVCYFLETRLKVIEYIRDGGEYSTFIEDNYVDPAKARLSFPEKKRNLIYIYLESMEDTFADQSAGGSGTWGKNIIPRLTKLSQEAEDFSGSSDPTLNGARALTGSTWTMGGIFAQSSGLPLKVSLNANGMNLMNHFFEKMTAIGDILQENGYRQVFLCGSDIVFGGRALFFQDHGNYELHDYNYAKAMGYIPEDYLVFWGYEDEKLYEIAKKEITELAKGDKPFNYSMLTVDTHPEDGYVCRLCGTEFGDNQYANVFHCADNQVCDFIQWLKEQDFYENTTVVINGDHCTMDADFCNDVDPSYQRRTYTAILNAAVEPALDERRNYSTMDNFPTTLAAMGVQIEGDRLGLGTNLFSDRKTILEEYGAEMANSEMKKNSKLMEELADINLEGGIMKNVRDQTVITLAPAQSPKNSLNVTVNMDYAFKEKDIEKVEIILLPADGSQSVQVKDMRAVYEENGGRSCYTINLTEDDLTGQGMNASIHIKMSSGEEYYLKSFYIGPPGTNNIILAPQLEQAQQ